jgi:hypothetical protein
MSGAVVVDWLIFVPPDNTMPEFEEEYFAWESGVLSG